MSLLFSVHMYLDQLAVRLVDERQRHGPGLRVGFRIVDRDVHVQVAEVLAPEPLRHLQVFTGRMPEVVQPDVVVEASRRHDERVAFPFSDRVAEPLRVGILRDLAAIGEDLPVRVHGFVQDDHHPGGVDDFEGVRHSGRTWNASDHAPSGRIFLALRVSPMLVQLCRPGLHRHGFLEVLGDIADVDAARQPDAGEIRFAVRRAGRRAVEVELAVGEARPGGSNALPLRRGRRGRHQHRHCGGHGKSVPVDLHHHHPLRRSAGNLRIL